MRVTRWAPALALVLLALPSAAVAKPSLSVMVKSSSQSQVLSAKAVGVSVYSKSKGSVRVTWKNGSSATLAFSKGGTKKATLKLSAKGRKAIAACGGHTVTVNAKRGKSKAIGVSRLTVDKDDCVKSATNSVDTTDADRCDFLDKSVCLFPFPNDDFTKADKSTDTGKRLNLNKDSMPANTAGVHIDPTDQNRADGFSPGNLIVTHVPGMDNQDAWKKTGAVPINDMARYADKKQPVVVIDAKTLQRHLIWTELDVNAKSPDDANLIIRPGVNWDEGHTYIVALRNMKTKAGKVIAPAPEFKAYRDKLKTTDKELEARRPHMDDILGKLAKAGIERGDLYLAWDFTVASEKSLTSRMLAIRDDAFHQLGDDNLADLKVDGNAPTFAVTSVENFQPCGTDGCQEGEDNDIARRIKGTITVPCYLDLPGCIPGGKFNLGSDGLPKQIPGNIDPAPFECEIPRQQIDGDVPAARPSLYGHGLLGTADEVEAGNVEAMANEHNFVFCATDWQGMSTPDAANVLGILNDLSKFPTLADRTQQGMLNFLYLGRAMIHPQGFNANPAFQVGTVPHGVFNTQRLFYDGNSQGGIMGGSLTAVAPDFNRAVLGVPAMNYSTLLRRSVDFDTYAQFMYAAYPSERERPLYLSLIQLLWDRGEADGYAHHMTDDPLPDTPAHSVLMHLAFGDHQVTNAAAEVEARTIGASATPHELDSGRSYDKTPLFGIPVLGSFPFKGDAAIVYWDTGPIRPGATDGVKTPPTTETPPRPEDGYGKDPHSAPRSTKIARTQKSDWLQADGALVDVCNGAPCHSGSWAPGQ
jgi:hypothetical protein